MVTFPNPKTNVRVCTYAPIILPVWKHICISFEQKWYYSHLLFCNLLFCFFSVNTTSWKLFTITSSHLFLFISWIVVHYIITYKKNLQTHHWHLFLTSPEWTKISSTFWINEVKNWRMKVVFLHMFSRIIGELCWSIKTPPSLTKSYLQDGLRSIMYLNEAICSVWNYTPLPLMSNCPSTIFTNWVHPFSSLVLILNETNSQMPIVTSHFFLTKVFLFLLNIFAI